MIGGRPHRRRCVAAVMLWRRLPLLLCVVVAVLVTAGLRAIWELALRTSATNCETQHIQFACSGPHRRSVAQSLPTSLNVRICRAA
jgi:hypothetical protein